MRVGCCLRGEQRRWRPQGSHWPVASLGGARQRGGLTSNSVAYPRHERRRFLELGLCPLVPAHPPPQVHVDDKAHATVPGGILTAVLPPRCLQQPARCMYPYSRSRLVPRAPATEVRKRVKERTNTDLYVRVSPARLQLEWARGPCMIAAICWEAQFMKRLTGSKRAQGSKLGRGSGVRMDRLWPFWLELQLSICPTHPHLTEVTTHLGNSPGCLNGNRHVKVGFAKTWSTRPAGRLARVASARQVSITPRPGDTATRQAATRHGPCW